MPADSVPGVDHPRRPRHVSAAFARRAVGRTHGWETRHAQGGRAWTYGAAPCSSELADEGFHQLGRAAGATPRSLAPCADSSQACNTCLIIHRAGAYPARSRDRQGIAYTCPGFADRLVGAAPLSHSAEGRRRDHPPQEPPAGPGVGTLGRRILTARAARLLRVPPDG